MIETTNRPKEKTFSSTLTTPESFIAGAFCCAVDLSCPEWLLEIEHRPYDRDAKKLLLPCQCLIDNSTDGRPVLVELNEDLINRALQIISTVPEHRWIVSALDPDNCDQIIGRQFLQLCFYGSLPWCD